MIRGQHGVAACDDMCKDVTSRVGEVHEWMIDFDLCIIKFDTSVEIKQKLARQHGRACSLVEIRAF